MKVSVIVPVYNHARYLRQRLDSILDQTFRDYELIVLDDGSSDNSRKVIQEYVEKYPGIITCFNESNNGSPFKQWNKGVSLSRGEFIWIAESDDYADSHFLEKTLQEISKSERCGFVFTDTWVIDEEKRIKYRFSDRRKNNPYSVKRITINSIVSNPIPNASSVLFRRDAYLDSGCADESMKFCADWFLTVKIVGTIQVNYLHETLSTYRLHEGSSYHQHYTSNRIISEKWKICNFLLRHSRFSITLYMQIVKCLTKTSLLRLLHFFRLPERLMPEIPHRPNKLIELI